MSARQDKQSKTEELLKSSCFPVNSKLIICKSNNFAGCLPRVTRNLSDMTTLLSGIAQSLVVPCRAAILHGTSRHPQVLSKNELSNLVCLTDPLTRAYTSISVTTLLTSAVVILVRLVEKYEMSLGELLLMRSMIIRFIVCLPLYVV